MRFRITHIDAALVRRRCLVRAAGCQQAVAQVCQAFGLPRVLACICLRGMP
jgi:hydroxylamine reductase (hybrid-cluster protein)